MKIYLAGPLFTRAELDFNNEIAWQLRLRHHEVFLPQEHEQKPPDATARSIFNCDRGGVMWADIVVANMDGSDPDSGTCWECGFANAKNKPVILYRTDIRREEDFGPFNLMLHQSADASLDCRGMGTARIGVELCNAITRIMP